MSRTAENKPILEVDGDFYVHIDDYRIINNFYLALAEQRKVELEELTTLRKEMNRLSRIERRSDRKSLELLLLTMWSKGGFSEIYKYKNRINYYRREDLSGIELFHDVTYQLFKDVEDIANYRHALPMEYKVSVDYLIQARVDKDAETSVDE